MRKDHAAVRSYPPSLQYVCSTVGTLTEKALENLNRDPNDDTESLARSGKLWDGTRCYPSLQYVCSTVGTLTEKALENLNRDPNDDTESLARSGKLWDGTRCHPSLQYVCSTVGTYGEGVGKSQPRPQP